MVKDCTRKLTKQKASFLLTIPKDLVIELSLKEGDQITLHAVNDKIILSKVKKNKKFVYTIGYAGKTMEQILTIMEKNNIEQLIDVRNNAFSMKNGFSKKPLLESIEKNGYRYLHMPLLGAPKNIRVEIKENGNRELFFKLYRNWLQKNNHEFRELISVITATSSVLMCVEGDYRDCHRKVLAEELSKVGFEIIHI